MSPTVLRTDGLRFFFYSREVSGGSLEPRHVHVRKGGVTAKVWLDSVRVAYSVGCSPGQLRRIRQLTREHRHQFLETWDEYFGGHPS